MSNIHTIKDFQPNDKEIKAIVTDKIMEIFQRDFVPYVTLLIKTEVLAQENRFLKALLVKE